MGDLKGLKKINDTCGKTMHREKMDRDFSLYCIKRPVGNGGSSGDCNKQSTDNLD
jgi:hypothetical protein